MKLSGNEVDYTILFILLVKNMLCGKLHCQRVLNLKAFSYEIAGVFLEHGAAAALPRQRAAVEP